MDFSPTCIKDVVTDKAVVDAIFNMLKSFARHIKLGAMMSLEGLIDIGTTSLPDLDNQERNVIWRQSYVDARRTLRKAAYIQSPN